VRTGRKKRKPSRKTNRQETVATVKKKGKELIALAAVGARENQEH
jgi:hypothetical protein